MEAQTATNHEEHTYTPRYETEIALINNNAYHAQRNFDKLEAKIDSGFLDIKSLITGLDAKFEKKFEKLNSLILKASGIIISTLAYVAWHLLTHKGL